MRPYFLEENMELNENVLKELCEKLNIKEKQANAVLEMLEDDKTVAFIARYRKEATGGLDEEQIRAIADEYEYGVNLLKRKEDVKRLINEKGLLTDELKNAIDSATKLVEIEDLYRPFKEKKKTKASDAIALGLEPLAKYMLSLPLEGDKAEIAKPYLNDKVETAEFAYEQAKYIIAEIVSDNAEYRKVIREHAFKFGFIVTKKKNNDLDQEEKYLNYYDSKEQINKIKPHRMLAINRAEDENVISVNLVLDPEFDINYLNNEVIKNTNTIFKEEIEDAILDSYKRLISPAIGREIRASKNEEAEEQAINIFSLNLKNLLMQPPMKGHVVLGVDPAFRTGCKLAVISPSSNVLEIGVIYPNEKSKGATVDEALVNESKKTIVNLIKKYNVEIIAIGNGTASRETESFIADVIKENGLDTKYVIVSEAGASVYSASQLGIEEFPDLHVEQRSAISIARRIQDPLAELVKIDPKSIGVGQYQHDVAQNKLNKSLDDVVSDAVNHVGVNLNTASVALLSYVSGLSKTISKNIISYREEHGKFNSREDLKKVAKLGPKTYEQCVGFLRVLEGDNKLDMTSIHPESYDKALKLLDILGLTVDDLGSSVMNEKLDNVNKEELMASLDIDSYTLDDIIDAFKAPLRDIRDSYDGLKLRSDIMHFEDIKIGDELDGTVRNVVDFGAFVDCGVKYDGLVHISKMSLKKINHPTDILAVGDSVHVYVIGIDYEKHKLELSMVKDIELYDKEELIKKMAHEEKEYYKDFNDLKVGEKLTGKVKSIADYGIFIDCNLKYPGLCHISRMSLERVENPNLLYKVGDEVTCYVYDVDFENHKLSLSLVEDIDKKKEEIRNSIIHFKDVKIGDEFDGEVKQLTNFGCFIDCGFKPYGLCHISRMSLKKVENPADIVKVGDKVHVYVSDIDYDNHKLALSMIKALDLGKTLDDLKVGDELDGIVKRITEYGAFVDCGVKTNGLIHISKMSKERISSPYDVLLEGDKVHCYVIGVDYINSKLSLSLIKED